MWPPAPYPPLVLTSLKWPRRLKAGSHSRGRGGHPHTELPSLRLEGISLACHMLVPGKEPNRTKAAPPSAAHHRDPAATNPSLIGGNMGNSMGLSLGFLN